MTVRLRGRFVRGVLKRGVAEIAERVGEGVGIRMEKGASVNALTEAIIGAAIEVHRQLGPGLLESVYRKCLAYELRKRGHDVVEEQPIPVVYDGRTHECGFRADLLVDGLIVVELKAKSSIHPIDKAQTLSHLRLMGLPVGLLMNFHEVRLVDGLSRIVNDYEGPKLS